MITGALLMGRDEPLEKHVKRLIRFFIVLVSAMFFLVMLRLRGGRLQPGERAKRVIDLFCGCSFGIYLIHILFLDNYKKHMEPYDLSAWIAVPALVASITAVSFLCVWLLRRTKLGWRIT